ncbi:MAG TPA: PSD1 and planctomycete cytochrome C domain-containing protein, partial [Chthonomonadaceae bacterium]|nr:PSD1 and planctomycete cytochrome C domain-containing protein [Chthonomonadaceae bacterium]
MNSCLPKAALMLLLAAVTPGIGALLPDAHAQTSAKTPDVRSEGDAFFTDRALPILQNNCFSCHSGAKPMGGLRLTGRQDILQGGQSGPAAVPQKPEESLIIRAINYQGRQMPPTGKLPQAQIEVLTQWVKKGLPWPRDGKAIPEPTKHFTPPQVTPETMRFWSFQPVRRPAIPKVRQKSWVRNPIDAFVLKRLEAAGLAPSPPASKAALIRRVTYDLTGLPPSPEQVQAFLADTSPDAYEKLVDRLLASPRYGEKWGRHWLDLVRYAETNSYERDGPKPNAWRYRDYVIQSFNQDKPYTRFLTEQLAGDELPNRTPEQLIATGYYRLGLWDDEPADSQQALYDDLDDIVSTTGQVFLGLTINCARCHDHKLDPIPQKDYYRFLSFFNGLTRYGEGSPESVAAASLRPIALESEIQKNKAEVAAYEAKKKANQDASLAIEQKVMADLAPVEKEEFRNEDARPAILRKRVPKRLSQAEFDRYLALSEERKALEKAAPKALDMALCVTEVGTTPRETHILLRGNPHVEGDTVAPGFPSVLNPPAPNIAPCAASGTSGRRTALARWIASERNPLTARVMVNRVWHYHFGRGIVRTPSDFGFQGAKPTHPELLDWLAAEFMARGWRLKPLHRLILLSSTYRMASQANPRALAKDPANDLLWRFDMRRLEAEEVRDSILAVNGSLNLKMGGPSIYPVMPEAVLAGQSMPGAGWGQSPPEEQRRRSVYIHVKRSLITPILASFD